MDELNPRTESSERGWSNAASDTTTLRILNGIEPTGPEVQIAPDQKEVPAEEKHRRLTMKEISKQYYATLLEPYRYSANKLVQQVANGIIEHIKAETNILRNKRNAGENYKARFRYIQEESPHQQEIRKGLIDLGIAILLVQKDWSVNRKKAVSDGFGTIPFQELECRMLELHVRYGLMNSSNPKDLDSKKVHLDLGPGNGEFIADLRGNQTEHPFGEEDLILADFFAEVGFGDRIYFTLEDLLVKVMHKEKVKKHPEVLEFIHVISTLLLRKIFFLEQKIKARMRKELIELGYDKNISQLTENIYSLLLDNIKNRTSMEGYENHSEYIIRVINIINSIQEEIPDDIADLLILGKDPNLIRKILKKLTTYIPQITKLQEIQTDTEFVADKQFKLSPECKELIGKYIGVKDQRKDQFLVDFFDPKFFDPDKNHDKQTDLAKHITTHAHNIFLEDFSRFHKVFAEGQIFDLVHAFRSTSHATDKTYETINREVILRLKDGGFFIHDGAIESYTRCERFQLDQKLAQDLKKEFGDKFRFEVIAGENGPKSILVQRGIPDQKGEYTFFTQEEKQSLLAPGCRLVPLENYNREWPERVFRNEVIKELRHLMHNTDFFRQVDPKNPESSFLRNQGFRDIHHVIEYILGRVINTIFTEEEWEGYKEDPHSEKYYNRISYGLGEVLKGIRTTVTQTDEDITTLLSA